MCAPAICAEGIEANARLPHMPCLDNTGFHALNRATKSWKKIQLSSSGSTDRREAE